jgi:hypothetical protein
MLRIRYKDRKTAFDFKGIKKAQCAAVIAGHLRMWLREQRVVDGLPRSVPLEKEGWSAAWQDGNVWDEDAAGEAVPIP